MDDKSQSKPKDNWDKLEIAAKLSIALVIPVITGAATFFITKYQTAPAAIDLAAQIYASPNCEDDGHDEIYCRSEEMDELANHLLDRYVDFEMKPGAGNLIPAPMNPSSPTSLLFCTNACEKDPNSALCKYQCPYWQQ